MPFVDYQLLSSKYSTEDMSENIQLLKEFDLFHCLLAGSPGRAGAVKKRVPNLPNDFLNWLEVCDGGLLFDTIMLTTKSHDAELDLDFYTYGNFFNAELRQSINISNDWFVFAIAIHDDVFFFDMEKQDGQVYQWDVEENTIYAYWDTFEDWLSDQIHEAIELIADQLLPFVAVKMEVIENE